MNFNMSPTSVNYFPPSIIVRGNNLLLDKEFYTPQELAGLLQLKVPTIYKYVREGKLPVYRFGKELRFNRDDVKNFLEQHRVKKTDKEAIL
ncbi:MAG: Uncharacterized protein FD167_2649 [bacterium]|nr:MAG: Uncharacterized protein FD167_2649 [bacterium]